MAQALPSDAPAGSELHVAMCSMPLRKSVAVSSRCICLVRSHCCPAICIRVAWLASQAASQHKSLMGQQTTANMLSSSHPVDVARFASQAASQGESFMGQLGSLVQQAGLPEQTANQVRMEAVVWGMAHKRLVGRCGVGCGAGTLQACHWHLACMLIGLQAWAGKCGPVQSQGALVCAIDFLTQPTGLAKPGTGVAAAAVPPSPNSADLCTSACKRPLPNRSSLGWPSWAWALREPLPRPSDRPAHQRTLTPWQVSPYIHYNGGCVCVL